MTATTQSAGLQTIDFSPFLQSKDPAVRKAKAEEIVAALHVQGTVGIVGHSLPVERLRAAFEVSRKFFALPFDEKAKASHVNGIVPHRGFSGIGREKCLVYTEEELERMEGELSPESTKPLDLKEHYDIGSDEEKVHYNLWIDEDAYPGFRAFTIGLYWELEALARAVQEALVLGLEVSEDAANDFKKNHTGQQNGLRLLHYPSASKAFIDRNPTTWCPMHTDFTTFTMLFQDDKQGLEIEDRTSPGTFLQASTEIENRLYLTIGDFGEIWSNGYLPASKHRVIIPEAMDGTDITPPRYSMPYFVNSEHDWIVGPQQTGKPGTMPNGKFKTGTVKEHIEFRMAHQY
ncbi:2-oxoglutarate-dependent dioxygenase htyE [Cladobotryum mycophilum]|uniref:2-oxoglutarate-dependent dioxygenase htyE n=1 Tax=Cladobotryum mycophilum TaxID=491253 RepID=A0ABR0SHJ4_9HYPO